ncbi:MAG: GGDEF domain-containing protein [Planctomycetes bacterium]|nr:GGDEF domain-containing protein [Planctomycetota bacterium]
MLAFFIAVAAVNIGMGFAVAIAHDRWIAAPTGSAEARVLETSPAARGAAASNVRGSEITTPSEPAISEDWRGAIEGMGVSGAGLRESALWVLLREAEQLGTALRDVEHAVKSGRDVPPDAVDSRDARARSLAANLHEAVERLNQERDSDRATRPLSDVVMDHAMRWEQSQPSGPPHNAAGKRAPSPDPNGWATLREQLEMTFRLRDELEELLALELRSRDRVLATPTPLLLNPQLALYNRVGLEYVYQIFRRDEDHQRETVSLALVDIDRFHRVHQQVSSVVGDRLLGAFARNLEEGLRQNRGFDRVTRIGGSTFVFVLGGTPIEGAELACERLRQEVEATSFRVGDREFELTVSCAAVTLASEESIAEAIDRLRAALGEARRAGRNRTCVHTETGLAVVEPKHLPVTGVTIEVPVA